MFKTNKKNNLISTDHYEANRKLIIIMDKFLVSVSYANYLTEYNMFELNQYHITVIFII
jgi:hypothetical protein